MLRLLWSMLVGLLFVVVVSTTHAGGIWYGYFCDATTVGPCTPGLICSNGLGGTCQTTGTGSVAVCMLTSYPWFCTQTYWCGC